MTIVPLPLDPLVDRGYLHDLLLLDNAEPVNSVLMRHQLLEFRLRISIMDDYLYFERQLYTGVGFGSSTATCSKADLLQAAPDSSVGRALATLQVPPNPDIVDTGTDRAV